MATIEIRGGQPHYRDQWGRLISGWPPEAAPQVGQLELFGLIALDETEPGVTAGQFIARLNALGAVDEIALSIDCAGGVTVGMWAIVEAIQSNKARVCASIVGRCNSAAAAVALACDDVSIVNGGQMMLHGSTCGNCPRCDCKADDAKYIEFIAARSGNSVATVRNWLEHETYFSAWEATRHKLASRVSVCGRVRSPINWAGLNRPS